MGPRQRVWGYTGSMGMVQAFSAGYFSWDLIAASHRPDVHGKGAIAHAASALAVSMLGFVSQASGLEPQLADWSSDLFATTMVSILCSMNYQHRFLISIGFWIS